MQPMTSFIGTSGFLVPNSFWNNMLLLLLKTENNILFCKSYLRLLFKYNNGNPYIAQVKNINKDPIAVAFMGAKLVL